MVVVPIEVKHGEIEYREVYSVQDMPDIKMSVNVERRKTSDGWYVKNHATIPMSFDIETSDYSDGTAMYIWQFAIGTETVVMGRTWSEFETLIGKLKQLPYVCHIFVHNLSYEMNFCIEFLKRSCSEVDVFMKTTRQALTIKCDNMVFHDSLAISGMNLDITTHDYNSCYFKAKGDLDYTIPRNCETVLTDTELGYCILDVLSLNEYIITLVNSTNYKLYELPITKTSFVRKDVLRECRKDKKYRERFKQERLTAEQYKILKKAFQGGLTCGNGFKEGMVISGDIRCRDITSSYPYQTLARYFPRTAFYPYEFDTIDNFMDMINLYCVICKATFIGLALKDKTLNCKPFISYSKCEMSECAGCELYNGKVFSADVLVRYMCEVELLDILNHYEFKAVYFSNIMYAMRGNLPDPIRNKSIEYFDIKTTLKGVEGKELEYLMGKANLNSIYGMCATAIDREECTIDLDSLECTISRPSTVEEFTECLERYYKKKTSFVHYQWACYVTAWARHQVIEMMDICGENWLYTDTDSVYYISTPEIEKKFDEYNKQLPKSHGAYNRRGEWSELGEVTPDGEYSKFVQLGAKKYVKAKKDGKLIITVAGVPKSTGVKVLEGDIYNFKDGLVFPGEITGKLRPEYMARKPHIADVNGVKQETAGYIKLVPCDYKLSDASKSESWYDWAMSLEITDLDITQGFS